MCRQIVKFNKKQFTTGPSISKMEWAGKMQYYSDTTINEEQTEIIIQI